MFTGSEDIEEFLKGGGLKSGKMLEQKLSILKNAVRSLEQVHGRGSINEQPVEYENEDDDEEDKGHIRVEENDG